MCLFLFSSSKGKCCAEVRAGFCVSMPAFGRRSWLWCHCRTYEKARARVLPPGVPHSRGTKGGRITTLTAHLQEWGSGHRTFSRGCVLISQDDGANSMLNAYTGPSFLAGIQMPSAAPSCCAGGWERPLSGLLCPKMSGFITSE